MAVFCTRCGAQNDDYSQNCLQCQAPLPAIGGYQPIQPPTPMYGQAPAQMYGQPPTQYSNQVSGDKRAICGFMAIIFGGLGVHKFMLGYQKEGLIMLLVSVLSCGTLYPLMEGIAIFEGIKYLNMTDAQFAIAYIQKKTGWF